MRCTVSTAQVQLKLQLKLRLIANAVLFACLICLSLKNVQSLINHANFEASNEALKQVESLKARANTICCNTNYYDFYYLPQSQQLATGAREKESTATASLLTLRNNVKPNFNFNSNNFNHNNNNNNNNNSKAQSGKKKAKRLKLQPLSGAKINVSSSNNFKPLVVTSKQQKTIAKANIFTLLQNLNRKQRQAANENTNEKESKNENEYENSFYTQNSFPLNKLHSNNDVAFALLQQNAQNLNYSNNNNYALKFRQLATRFLRTVARKLASSGGGGGAQPADTEAAFFGFNQSTRLHTKRRNDATPSTSIDERQRRATSNVVQERKSLPIGKQGGDNKRLRWSTPTSVIHSLIVKGARNGSNSNSSGNSGSQLRARAKSRISGNAQRRQHFFGFAGDVDGSAGIGSSIGGAAAAVADEDDDDAAAVDIVRGSVVDATSGPQPPPPLYHLTGGGDGDGGERAAAGNALAAAAFLNLNGNQLSDARFFAANDFDSLAHPQFATSANFNLDNTQTLTGYQQPASNEQFVNGVSMQDKLPLSSSSSLNDVDGKIAASKVALPFDYENRDVDDWRERQSRNKLTKLTNNDAKIQQQQQADFLPTQQSNFQSPGGAQTNYDEQRWIGTSGVNPTNANKLQQQQQHENELLKQKQAMLVEAQLERLANALKSINNPLNIQFNQNDESGDSKKSQVVNETINSTTGDAVNELAKQPQKELQQTISDIKPISKANLNLNNQLLNYERLLAKLNSVNHKSNADKPSNDLSELVKQLDTPIKAPPASVDIENSSQNSSNDSDDDDSDDDSDDEQTVSLADKNVALSIGAKLAPGNVAIVEKTKYSPSNSFSDESLLPKTKLIIKNLNNNNNKNDNNKLNVGKKYRRKKQRRNKLFDKQANFVASSAAAASKIGNKIGDKSYYDIDATDYYDADRADYDNDNGIALNSAAFERLKKRARVQRVLPTSHLFGSTGVVDERIASGRQSSTEPPLPLNKSLAAIEELKPVSGSKSALLLLNGNNKAANKVDNNNNKEVEKDDENENDETDKDDNDSDNNNNDTLLAKTIARKTYLDEILKRANDDKTKTLLSNNEDGGGDVDADADADANNNQSDQKQTNPLLTNSNKLNSSPEEELSRKLSAIPIETLVDRLMSNSRLSEFGVTRAASNDGERRASLQANKQHDVDEDLDDDSDDEDERFANDNNNINNKQRRRRLRRRMMDRKRKLQYGNESAASSPLVEQQRVRVKPKQRVARKRKRDLIGLMRVLDRMASKRRPTRERELSRRLLRALTKLAVDEHRRAKLLRKNSTATTTAATTTESSNDESDADGLLRSMLLAPVNSPQVGKTFEQDFREVKRLANRLTSGDAAFDDEGVERATSGSQNSATKNTRNANKYTALDNDNDDDLEQVFDKEFFGDLFDVDGKRRRQRPRRRVNAEGKASSRNRRSDNKHSRKLSTTNNNLKLTNRKLDATRRRPPAPLNYNSNFEGQKQRRLRKSSIDEHDNDNENEIKTVDDTNNGRKLKYKHKASGAKKKKKRPVLSADESINDEDSNNESTTLDNARVTMNNNDGDDNNNSNNKNKVKEDDESCSHTDSDLEQSRKTNQGGDDDTR